MEPDNDMIPTYEESLQQGASPDAAIELKGKSQRDPSDSLNQRLSSVRTERINAILEDYIDPFLQSQALSGLSKTILVLVPFNSAGLQCSHSSGGSNVIKGSGDNISNDGGEVVVGFPSTDYVKLVRLQDEEYTLEFLRQTAVVTELSSALRAKLKATGHKVTPSATTESLPAVENSSPLKESPKVRRGIFQRRSKTTEKATDEPQPTAATSDSTWRIPAEEALLEGYVRVNVGLQEICLRTATEMGLYVTRTGKAVTVSIEIGA